MPTTVDWRQESGSGRVRLSQPGPGAARLFGLPFAAAGAYFLYFLAGGVLHPSQMTIFGWILLPLMTAAFLIPGWLLLTFRKRVTLDPTPREALEESDRARSASFLLHVYLSFDDRTILLALFGDDEKPAALAFAARVAALFAIDVQDRCFEHGEITSGGVVVERLSADEAD